MSNRPVFVVELKRRRLPTAASLSKDLETVTAWGFKNIVEFNATKTQYCTLSNKMCPILRLTLFCTWAIDRCLWSRWNTEDCSDYFAVKGSGDHYHLVTQKYGKIQCFQDSTFEEEVPKPCQCANEQSGSTKNSDISLPNLLTRYECQIRPGLEYCSHIWEASGPTILSLFEEVQKSGIEVTSDPDIRRHLQSLSN
nr:unnamed protein product [Callosobruchus chinensis]